MMEVRGWEEGDNDTWETMALFEENELVKQAKPRARERLDSSEPGYRTPGHQQQGVVRLTMGPASPGTRNKAQERPQVTAHHLYVTESLT